jgi:hypothetical protein
MAANSKNERKQTPPPPGGPKDGLVVRVDEIVPLVQRWIEIHRADHPISNFSESTGRDNSASSIMVGEYVSSYSAEKVIAQEMGLSENGFDVGHLGRQKYIGYNRADRILSAIGQTHALFDGRVHVIPNPNWSQERWLAWKEEQGCI